MGFFVNIFGLKKNKKKIDGKKKWRRRASRRRPIISELSRDRTLVVVRKERERERETKDERKRELEKKNKNKKDVPRRPWALNDDDVIGSFAYRPTPLLLLLLLLLFLCFFVVGKGGGGRPDSDVVAVVVVVVDVICIRRRHLHIDRSAGGTLGAFFSHETGANPIYALFFCFVFSFFFLFFFFFFYFPTRPKEMKRRLGFRFFLLFEFFFAFLFRQFLFSFFFTVENLELPGTKGIPPSRTFLIRFYFYFQFFFLIGSEISFARATLDFICFVFFFVNLTDRPSLFEAWSWGRTVGRILIQI